MADRGRSIFSLKDFNRFPKTVFSWNLISANAGVILSSEASHIEHKKENIIDTEAHIAISIN